MIFKRRMTRSSSLGFFGRQTVRGPLAPGVEFEFHINVVHSILEMPDPRSRRLIVASTAEVYGIQERRPFKETLSLND
jgi:UDP-glucose 4-epimerase